MEKFVKCSWETPDTCMKTLTTVQQDEYLSFANCKLMPCIVEDLS